jgi:hypothetical protein
MLSGVIVVITRGGARDHGLELISGEFNFELVL